MGTRQFGCFNILLKSSMNYQHSYSYYVGWAVFQYSIEIFPYLPRNRRQCHVHWGRAFNILLKSSGYELAVFSDFGVKHPFNILLKSSSSSRSIQSITRRRPTFNILLKSSQQQQGGAKGGKGRELSIFYWNLQQALITKNGVIKAKGLSIFYWNLPVRDFIRVFISFSSFVFWVSLEHLSALNFHEPCLFPRSLFRIELLFQRTIQFHLTMPVLMMLYAL